MAFSSIPSNAAGLFLTLAQQQDRFEPQIIGFDFSILSLATAQAPLLGPQTPAVIPPWQLPQNNDSPLASQVAAIRNLRSFINENAPGVEAVGVTPDSRSTFILFDALTKLETLAKFASEPSTPESSLARLEAQFQAGLAEVKSFLTTAPLENLTLLSGGKEFRVDSTVDLGSNTASFTGRSVATGTRSDPLAGIVGDEVLTLTLSKFGETVDITIDLAEIGGPVSISGFVDLVNSKIEAIPSLDANGDPVLDENGDPVSKFTTRFSVISDDAFDHAIRIEGSLLEEVNLKPAVADPVLYVSSSLSSIIGDDPESGRLLRLDDIEGAVGVGQRVDIKGVDLDASVIAADDGAEDAIAAPTSARAVAIDSEGFIYTVGTSTGSFDNQINASGAQDVFLEKRDSDGNVVFTRLLGSANGSDAFSIAIDSADNVIIAGQTSDNLADGARIAGLDSFVSKFSSTGDLLFTSQIDTASEDGAVDVTLDANDNIVITGFTRGAVDAVNPGLGGRDTLVVRFDGVNGARLDTAILGGAGDERGQAVAIASDGNLLVASRENGEAILRKLDINNLSTVLSEQSLGTIGASGTIAGIRVSGSDIFLAGTTAEAGFTGDGAVAAAASGGEDGFLLKLSDQGATISADFISFIGTANTDRINDIAISGTSAFLAGSTRGDISGDGKRGVEDGFVARIDLATGAIETVERFGQLLGNAGATGIALAATGPSILDALGLPLGSFDRTESRTIEAQTTARTGDFFEISIDGGRRQRIELKPGDDFRDLAAAINRLTSRPVIEASALSGGFSIKALGSASIELIAGDGNRDLLAKLGIEPQRILGETRLFELDSKPRVERPSNRLPPKIGGIFGLDLDGPLSLKDAAAARFTLSRISAAIETIKRAFRSLTPSPFDGQDVNGRVPPQLSKELGNYTAALMRLAPEFFFNGSFA